MFCRSNLNVIYLLNIFLFFFFFIIYLKRWSTMWLTWFLVACFICTIIIFTLILWKIGFAWWGLLATYIFSIFVVKFLIYVAVYLVFIILIIVNYILLVVQFKLFNSDIEWVSLVRTTDALYTHSLQICWLFS